MDLTRTVPIIEDENDLGEYLNELGYDVGHRRNHIEIEDTLILTVGRKITGKNHVFHNPLIHTYNVRTQRQQVIYPWNNLRTEIERMLRSRV